MYARTLSAKYSSRPDAAYGVTNPRAAENARRIFGSAPLQVRASAKDAV